MNWKRVENLLQMNCQFVCNYCSYESKWIFEVMFHWQFDHVSLIGAVCKSRIQIWGKVEFKVSYELASSNFKKVKFAQNYESK